VNNGESLAMILAIVLSFCFLKTKLHHRLNLNRFCRLSTRLKQKKIHYTYFRYHKIRDSLFVAGSLDQMPSLSIAESGTGTFVVFFSAAATFRLSGVDVRNQYYFLCVCVCVCGNR